MSLRNLIPYPLKVRYHIARMNLLGNPIYKISDYKPGKKIFLFLAADYGNLGDVALTYAETEFLNRHFPEYTVVEIIIRHSVEGLHFAKKYAGKHDLISIIGGGNMGDLYGGLEGIRRIIIKLFPTHRIISFPQSIHYSDTASGRASLAEAKAVYGRHKGLVLIARDPKSYEIMKQNFSANTVLLTPDIVFSQNQIRQGVARKGVVLSLRRDIEKALTPEEDQILHSAVHAYFTDITEYDTNIGKSYLSTPDKYAELHKIWDAYRHAQLVVTDRLHGMIFCYITNTPCIVLLNNNHKIEFAYEWIKFSDAITLVNKVEAESIRKHLERHKHITESKSYQSLDHLFRPLLDALRGESIPQ